MEAVLVVDDDLVNLQYISSQLAGAYTLIPAKSGKQALDIAETRFPDLILLDIAMPGMDGFETLARLQKNNRLSHIPVIFLTADHTPETEMRGLKAGAKDFITKPFGKGVLLHRVELHLRLSRYQKQLQLSVKELEDSIAVSFAELIECRDENTGGHVQRTSEYMTILGRALRTRGYFENELQDDELGMMIRAAPLHDIGKIGVSDAVLFKPGKLTNDEFDAMKKHTTVGAAILGAMFARLPTQRYLLYAKMIAESHHERYDGKGYPYQTGGDSIPLCARIMAVVDVYDALVADRIYRKAMSHEEACGIIFAGKGANFDPQIVTVFEEIHEIFLHCREHLAPVSLLQLSKAS